MAFYKNKRTALIAEDDFVAAELLSGYLKKNRFDVEHAKDGEDAVKSINIAMEKGDPFRLVCLDIEMPKLDGLSVLRNLRKIEDEQTMMRKSDMSVVFFVTAHNTVENSVRAFEGFGCDGFLSKPINEKSLTKLLYNNGLG